MAEIHFARSNVSVRKVNNSFLIKQTPMTKVFELTLPIVRISPRESRLRRWWLRRKAALFSRLPISRADSLRPSTILSHAVKLSPWCAQTLSKWQRLQKILERQYSVTIPTRQEKGALRVLYATRNSSGLIALAQSEIVLTQDELTLSLSLPDEYMSRQEFGLDAFCALDDERDYYRYIRLLAAFLRETLSYSVPRHKLPVRLYIHPFG